MEATMKVFVTFQPNTHSLTYFKKKEFTAKDKIDAWANDVMDMLEEIYEEKLPMWAEITFTNYRIERLTIATVTPNNKQ